MVNNLVTFIFRGIALLIVNIVTLILMFSLWGINHTPLFPWALLAIIFSLSIINIATLTSNKIINKFGIGAYTALTTSSIIYYIFIMVFTGFTYYDITTLWYIIIILVATLFYVSTISGLYVSSFNKNKDMADHELENQRVMNLNLQIITIHEKINSLKKYVDQDSYLIMIESFNDMNERLKASTPFAPWGRTW